MTRAHWYVLAAIVLSVPYPCQADTADEAYRRGFEALNKRDLDEALDAFNEAIRLDPKKMAAYWGRSTVYYGKGRIGKAIADLDQAIQLEPNESKLYYTRGFLHTRQDAYEKAIADFTETLRLDPKNFRACSNRAVSFAKLRKYDAAFADFAEALRLSPNNGKILADRGSVHAWKGDHEKAIQDFTKSLQDTDALRLDPTLIRVYIDRAMSYEAIGKNDKAIADYDECIKRGIKEAPTYAARGRLYSLKGDYTKAVADYNEAIRLDPKNASRYRARGSVYKAEKDYDKALADFSEVIRLDPKQSEAYSHRAEVYELKKVFVKAAADWRRCIQLAPNDEEYVNSLAWLLATCPKAEVRDGKKAVEYARKACELTKWQDADNLDTLAAAYAESGDFKEAVRWETKALELTAKDSPEKRKEMKARLALYQERKALPRGEIIVSRLQLAIEQIAAARSYTIGRLDQTPAADWFRQPPGGVSHIAWQVGHLAMAEYRLALERIRGPQPQDAELISEEFLRTFGRTSTPETDPAKYPSQTEIRAVFDRVHEQALRELRELDERELDQPVLKPHPLAKTKLWALLWCAQHEMIHAGQIGLLRRQLGHPPIW